MPKKRIAPGAFLCQGISNPPAPLRQCPPLYLNADYFPVQPYFAIFDLLVFGAGMDWLRPKRQNAAIFEKRRRKLFIKAIGIMAIVR